MEFSYQLEQEQKMEEMIRSDSCVSFRSFGVFCLLSFTTAESRSIKELGVDVVIAGDG